MNRFDIITFLLIAGIIVLTIAIMAIAAFFGRKQQRQEEERMAAMSPEERAAYIEFEKLKALRRIADHTWWQTQNTGRDNH